MLAQFDSRTATEVGAVAAFGVSMLSILLWRTRRTYPGFTRWVAGNCCAGSSMAGLAIHGFVPDWLSVLLANGGSFAGVVLLLEGNREFTGLPAKATFARVAACLAMLVQLFFLVAVNNIGIRIEVSAIFLATLTIVSAITLFRGIKPGRKLGFIFAGLFFLANAAFNVARGITTLRAWPASPDLFPPTFANQLYFGAMTLTVIGWAFAFILLTQDRIVEDLAAEEHRTALLNRELQQAVLRAERADRAKSDFLAYMSHEIRNPLSAVLMLSESALDGPLAEQKRPDLETLRHSAQSVLGIVNDILDLSKIEAGKMPVTSAPFDLKAELSEIAALSLAQARASATSVVLSYPADVPERFIGDARLIRQVVANFSANSVKFTNHGAIEILVNRIAGGVKISVRDTGIGISPDAIPRLFERYTQAMDSVRGTGLGLAIAKQLAELMGGNVGVQSEPGRGSTFWVELPLTPADLAKSKSIS